MKNGITKQIMAGYGDLRKSEKNFVYKAIYATNGLLSGVNKEYEFRFEDILK